MNADPNQASTNAYFTHDYSLTVTGLITAPINPPGPEPGSLVKVGAGNLILPVANNYNGFTDIKAGFITVQQDQALGAQNGALPQTLQAYTTVESGAALMLKPLVPGTFLSLPYNFNLSGPGVTHHFGPVVHSGINEMGAIVNLDGANHLTGIIQFDGVASIGVEQVFPLSATDIVPSQLTTTGPLWDSTPVLGPASAVFPSVSGGITKYGSERLIVQGPGTYTGPVDVFQGPMLIQNSTGLGAGIDPATGKPTTTTVENGATLELANSINSQNGGIASGLAIYGEQLILNGTGDVAHGDLGPITILTSATATGPFNDAIFPTDDMWAGPITLASDSTIDVQTNGRLVVTGVIDDGAAVTPTPPPPASLGLLGTGELDLYGQNTYRGTTDIKQGVLTVGNSEALGGTGVAAVQTVTLTGATAGTTQFTLEFNGQTTGPIPYTGNSVKDTNAIAAALTALSTIAGAADLGGAVTVTQPATGVFQIVLGGSLLGFSQPKLQAAVTTSPGSANVVIATDGYGGTIVESGAQLQLAGSVTIAGEPLEVHGAGDAKLPNVPQQWFPVGPAPITNGQTVGSPSANVAGRVTGVVADPRDPNIIYIATAGGGAWKTIDGGLSWHPIFDSIPEIETVTLNGNGTQFTLQFTGPDSTGAVVTDPTSTITYSATDPDQTALAIQTALNKLTNIGDVGGFVTVTQAAAGGGNAFTVTFQGTLSGESVNSLASSVTGGPSGGTAVIGLIEQGQDPQFAMYVGAITLDPTNSNVLYLGTGETNNSTDSFYGTGLYKSTDGGVTWALVLDNVTTPGTPINPFYGKGISSIAVDPNSPSTLYVADADGGSGLDEKESLTFNGLTPGSSQFTISFKSADVTGAVVNDTSAPLTFTNNTNTLATNIANALNGFSNILGVGASVVVTFVKGGKKGPGSYVVTFQGALSDETLPLLTTNYPLPAPNQAPPTIGVLEVTRGGPAQVVNGTSGMAGIWRYLGGAWFDMTDVVSNNRAASSAKIRTRSSRRTRLARTTISASRSPISTIPTTGPSKTLPTGPTSASSTPRSPMMVPAPVPSCPWCMRRSVPLARRTLPPMRCITAQTPPA